MMAAIGILGALLECSVTGKGKFVDISLTEAAMMLGIPAFSQALAVDSDTDIIAGEGLLDGGLVNYQVYKTQDDRYIAVGALEPHFWEKFCTSKEVNRPDLASSTSHSEVASLFASKKMSEWTSIASATDCCIEPILTVKEVFNHAQHKDRGVMLTKNNSVYKDSDDTSLKPHNQLVVGPRFSSPGSMNNSPAVFLDPASTVGEHTDELLLQSGFKIDEIEKLRLSKAVF